MGKGKCGWVVGDNNQICGKPTGFFLKLEGDKYVKRYYPHCTEHVIEANKGQLKEVVAAKYTAKITSLYSGN